MVSMHLYPIVTIKKKNGRFEDKVKVLIKIFLVVKLISGNDVG